MATSRLKIYNGALMLCEARSIASLTVNEESRRLLDDVYNDDGIGYCLEQGQWGFAMRGAKFDYDTTITPQFGYSRAFQKPSDWVLTSALCGDEYYQSPVTGYVDEAGYWYADLDEIYVRYVSDDSSYGGDMSKWPQTFTEYVKHYFAWRICKKMPGGGEDRIERIRKEMERALLAAKNKNAMTGPTQFMPRGAWLEARFGGASRRDGGNRHGNLIG